MLATAFIFIALAILIKHGKMYWLIAGYNTLPEKERSKYDIEGIATVFRNTLFAMAFLILIGYGVGHWMGSESIKTYSFFLSVIIGIPYLLIRVNSRKFRKE